MSNQDAWPEEGTPEYEAWQASHAADAEAQRQAAGLEKASEPKVLALQGATGAQELTAADIKEMTLDQLSAILGVLEASDAIGTDQYGPILEDKGKLVGVPLVVVHWLFYQGDFGEFVSAWVQTMNGDKYIVNDGSSGIYAQLKELSTSKQLNAMLVCKHGLRVSKYDKEMPNGVTLKDCETFYVDTKL